MCKESLGIYSSITEVPGAHFLMIITWFCFKECRMNGELVWDTFKVKVGAIRGKWCGA